MIALLTTSGVPTALCCPVQAEAVAAARAEASSRAAAMHDELSHKLQDLQQQAAQVGITLPVAPSAMSHSSYSSRQHKK
jgi:hypothetical protein